MKKFIISLAITGAIFCASYGAFAAQPIGVVDMSKILSNSLKAQAITEAVKDQQTEIQKMIVDARNQISAAETDIEKQELEKKLSEEIQQKNNIFKADYEKNVQALQDNIISSVKKIAAKKKIDFIFKKDNIVTGGKDITDEVLAELNK